MKQHLALTAIVVQDYDEAIAFYVGKLGFELIDDTYQPEQDKRWVVVAPPGAVESRLLLARATSDDQVVILLHTFCSTKAYDQIDPCEKVRHLNGYR